MTKPIPERVAVRAALAYRENAAGCYISTYSVGTHGYAQICWKDNGRTQMTTAQRAAWVCHTGVQPGELTVDHTCRTPRCVRREHLRLLPRPENSRRNNGHDYPEGWTCWQNHQLRRNKRGECPACREITRNKWADANPAQAADIKARHRKKRQKITS